MNVGTRVRFTFWILLAGMFAIACGSKFQSNNTNQSTASNQSQGTGANYSQACTASFELFHEVKPFDNEQLAIFPLVDGKISTKAENKLGSGRTNDAGRGTIDFKCSESAAKYVFLWEPDGKCCSMLRQRGQALSFTCGGAQKKCELGKIVFEVFEFGFGG